MKKEQIMKEYSLGKLLQINWNRMSELSGINPNKKTEKEQTEYRCRLNIQNGFATNWSDKGTKELILWLNNQTKINVEKYLLKA